MSAAPQQQTFFLDAAGEPAVAILHLPASETARNTGVILCPPFGWDEVCSYRPRRDWAQRLAAAGYATLRLSYPATGDSGGDPEDPGRLEAWTASVSAAAEWLKAEVSVRRIVAIGLELGGLLAYRAAAADAAIDDLVLWATPGRGRALTRQIRAFSALELSEFFRDLEAPPPLPDGHLQAGGFLLSAETVDALGRINLGELPLPNAPSRRALLLDRDGIAVDAALRERLESLGATVEVRPGGGYKEMTSHPQTALAPMKVIESVKAWLDEGSSPARNTTPELRPEQLVAQIGPETREQPLTLRHPDGELSAIVTEPVDHSPGGPCVVLLNAGAVRRTGPNRMWVEAARRWARHGVRSVRLDVEGIGDASGATTPYAENGSLYDERLVAQVDGALDQLSDLGLGQRFILVGLCAGAYWAFQLALDDPRVQAAAMLNPRQLDFNPNRAAAKDFRALFSAGVTWAQLRKNATRQRVRAVGLWLLMTPARALRRLRAPRGLKPADQALERLRSSDKRALFVFGENEPLRDELTRTGALDRIAQWENVKLEYIPVRDHTFRPHHSQREVHEVLDRMLELELPSKDAAAPRAPVEA
jgi:dienelactone hydrolase